MNLPSPPDPIVLPPSCMSVAAMPLRDALSAAADAGGPIRIDGSQVENIGQAVFQLLLAARSEPDGIEWAAASDALRNRAGALGLAHHLGLGE